MKINISIKDELFREIKEKAESDGRSISGFFRWLYLQKYKKEGNNEKN